MHKFIEKAFNKNATISDIEYGAPTQLNLNILDTLRLDQALNLAKKKIREGSDEEAKQVYRDILNKFPKNKKAQKGLAVLNNPPQEFVNRLIQVYNQGRLVEAIRQAQIILEKYPSSSDVWEVLGSAALKRGDFDLSVLAFLANFANLAVLAILAILAILQVLAIFAILVIVAVLAILDISAILDVLALLPALVVIVILAILALLAM